MKRFILRVICIVGVMMMILSGSGALIMGCKFVTAICYGESIKNLIIPLLILMAIFATLVSIVYLIYEKEE